jgi:hypothetical protein
MRRRVLCWLEIRMTWMGGGRWVSRRRWVWRTNMGFSIWNVVQKLVKMCRIRLRRFAGIWKCSLLIVVMWLRSKKRRSLKLMRLMCRGTDAAKNDMFIFVNFLNHTYLGL